MQICNAAAGQMLKAPPFISYTVCGTNGTRSETRSFSRTVMSRTADQLAIVADGSGKESLKTPFPAPPTLDVLGEWRFDLKFDKGELIDFAFGNLHPRTYDLQSRPDADAIARAVRSYTVRESAPGRLELEPRWKVQPNYLYLRQVDFSPETLLPARVRSEGAAPASFEVTYDAADGPWLLRSLRYEWRVPGAFGFGHATYAIEATYSAYRFNDTAPDPRLLASPAPSPASS